MSEATILKKKSGIIFNILRYCIHDGPGIRTTVFLKGCPLCCWWCHNPEGLKLDREVFYNSETCLQCGDCLDACPNDAIKNQEGHFIALNGKCLLNGTCVENCGSESRRMVGTTVTVSDVFKEINKDRVFYNESGGGVTFSGGEPLFQPDFLEALLRKCKDSGIHTTVDTSGYASSEVFEKIEPYTDLYLYDLKTLDETKHKKHTGVSNKQIIRNLIKLQSQTNGVIVRLPVIPGFNDNLKSIKKIGEFVVSLNNIKKIHILPYHKTSIEKYRRFGLDYSKHQTGSVSQKLINDIQSELTGLGIQICIGG